MSESGGGFRAPGPQEERQVERDVREEWRDEWRRDSMAEVGGGACACADGAWQYEGGCCWWW